MDLYYKGFSTGHQGWQGCVKNIQYIIMPRRLAQLKLLFIAVGESMTYIYILLSSKAFILRQLLTCSDTNNLCVGVRNYKLVPRTFSWWRCAFSITVSDRKHATLHFVHFLQGIFLLPASFGIYTHARHMHIHAHPPHTNTHTHMRHGCVHYR